MFSSEHISQVQLLKVNKTKREMSLSIVNHHATNLLKFGAVAFGVYYGIARNASLTSHVAERKTFKELLHYESLVEEAKIAYETHTMTLLAKEAKAAHSTLIS